MEAILINTLTFVTLLNPFALFIYLIPIQKELKWKDFIVTLTKASLIAGGIYLLSAYFGKAFFENVLKIDFESFRIFGGLVLILFAATFIVQGRKSFITLKGSLDELAGDIALPFMVGAGTISLSILIGSTSSTPATFIVIFATMLINFLIVLILGLIRNKSSKVPISHRLQYNTEILLRINGFILGAFGVDMVIKGVQALF